MISQANASRFRLRPRRGLSHNDHSNIHALDLIIQDLAETINE
jgi:hypothetical protein